MIHRSYNIEIFYSPYESNHYKMRVLRELRLSKKKKHRNSEFYITTAQEMILAARRWLDRKEHQKTPLKRKCRMILENYLVTLWNIIHAKP